MSVAQFSLVKKVPVVITRKEKGRYEEGEYVEGSPVEITVMANVHPFTDYQVSLLAESDRSKQWLWFFTASEIRAKREGDNGFDADRFQWDGEWFEMMKVQRFKMSVQDHFEGKAQRIELTPN